MPWLSRSRKIGLAAGAAVLAVLVLVGALTDDEPARRAGDSGRDGGRAKMDRRKRAAARKHTAARGRESGRSPKATTPGGGGDEGEQEWSVYVVAASGGRPRLAAGTPSEVPITPDWSRRTGLIAFVRPGCEDCDAAVWTTNPDGSRRRKLTARLGNLTDPVWSPSGHALAAVRVGGGLYMLGARSGRSRPLLARAVVEDPAWSPNGRAIAFARRRGAANWDLYAIAPRGGAARRLTRTLSQELAPAWSPDGRRIAYQRQDPSGAWSIYMMRADGSGARRLVAGTTAHNAEQPAWSPDGRTIAFLGVTLRGSRIEVVRRGGRAAPRPITGPELQAADPDWSPDGRRIAFSAKEE